MEAATGALNVRWIKSGDRFMLGHTQEEPHFYGIWARDDGAEPRARFPFTEHGKNEALAAFLTVEPNAADVMLDGAISTSAAPGGPEPDAWALSATRPAHMEGPPAHQAQPGSVKPAGNAAAVISLVLGILGMVSPLILSAPAIVFGFIGLSAANSRGAPGKGLAIAGLVLGLIGTMIGLGVIGKLGGMT